jgi:uncharacterized protein YbjT (DUF2867 family)
MKTALLVGASGLVGKQCLYRLLGEPEYRKVIIWVRKELPLKHTKLEQVVVNFDELENYAGTLAADDVFCCLGATFKAAKTNENFRKVDLVYPLHVAGLALKNGARQFLLVSALGASVHASAFYTRLKGDTEELIGKLGYPALHIFRPALLLGHRYEFRPKEFLNGKLMHAIRFLFVGPLLKYKAIDAAVVATAMVRTALQNQTGTYIHESDEMQRTARVR